MSLPSKSGQAANKKLALPPEPRKASGQPSSRGCFCLLVSLSPSLRWSQKPNFGSSFFRDNCNKVSRDELSPFPLQKDADGASASWKMLSDAVSLNVPQLRSPRQSHYLSRLIPKRSGVPR